MPKNREPSFPNPEQPGKIEELAKPFSKDIGVAHPRLFDARRAHRLKKATDAVNEIAPGFNLSDEADSSDLSPQDLELVDRVADEVDRIVDTGENPQKK